MKVWVTVQLLLVSLISIGCSSNAGMLDVRSSSPIHLTQTEDAYRDLATRLYGGTPSLIEIQAIMRQAGLDLHKNYVYEAIATTDINSDVALDRLRKMIPGSSDTPWQVVLKTGSTIVMAREATTGHPEELMKAESMVFNLPDPTAWLNVFRGNYLIDCTKRRARVLELHTYRRAGLREPMLINEGGEWGEGVVGERPIVDALCR